MNDLQKLFSPFKIKTMELKNRCVVSAMGINYANPDGTLNEEIIAYYAARAKGGFGLIISENTAISLAGRGLPVEPALWDDNHIVGWEKLAKAVHAYGAKLAVQLHSAGNKTDPEVTPGAQVLGPSPISYARRLGQLTKLDTPISKEMTEEDIEDTVEAFGEAARRARDAGCDAIEIHGAHGYLLGSFMSPAENKRIDRYGGAVDGRIKLAEDIISRIRRKVGREFPILWKMSADEMLPGGATLEETQLIIWLLAKAGINCIEVSRGSQNLTTHWMCPPLDIPPAAWVTQDTWVVKQSVEIPVIAVGKIIDPFMADFIIESGKADLVAFGRASLADPEIPNKAAAGRFEDIRYCLGCGTCNDTIRTGDFRAHCAINPELGREAGMLPLAPTKHAKKVLVAGAGPGGLEAARVAALRGHDVSLYEKSDRLGGQLWIGALPPGKQQLTHGLKWLSMQAEKAGVKIRLDKEVTASVVEELRPDVVIVATGGAPLIPKNIPGIEKPKVVTAWDVLTEKVRCGPKVAVLGGGSVGCEVADWLGFRRKEVTIIEMLENVAADMSFIARPFLMERLEREKVKEITGAEIRAITDEGVVISRNGQEETIVADSMVLALGTVPVNCLAEELKGKVSEIYIIGDAREPRKVLNTIEEGAVVARKI